MKRLDLQEILRHLNNFEIVHKQGGLYDSRNPKSQIPPEIIEIDIADENAAVMLLLSGKLVI